MKSTFRTLFYLRKDRANADGLVPIMIRITVNSQMTQFSSKLEVNPNLWDTKQGRAIGRTADATNLNRLLDNLRSKIDSLYNKELGDKGYALPDTIKNKLQGNDPERKSLVDYFNLHNEQYKLKIGNRSSLVTANRYELTKKRIIEYMREKLGIKDIMVQEVNYMFIENFYLYIIIEKGSSFYLKSIPFRKDFQRT